MIPNIALCRPEQPGPRPAPRFFAWPGRRLRRVPWVECSMRCGPRGGSTFLTGYLCTAEQAETYFPKGKSVSVSMGVVENKKTASPGSVGHSYSSAVLEYGGLYIVYQSWVRSNMFGRFGLLLRPPSIYRFTSSSVARIPTAGTSLNASSMFGEYLEVIRMCES